uniref:Uncharacterized protein n=1 Tax=Globisporangium ultimum (strain ATCC 200006 / CBS 805.95 / DAOM BR144) TaxID=431595 RepID=K3X4V7_GLOUD
MAIDTPGSANDHYEKNQVSTPDVAKHDKSSGHQRTRRCSPLAVTKTLLIVGALLVVVSVAYGTALPKVIDKKIKAGVVVCDEGDVKVDYTDPYGDCHDCTPYYYTLHMFNVTNPEEHLATGAKLALQEVGPYVYRRRQFKLDVSFDGNNRVSYKQYTYHTYEPAMSCAGCAESDVYTGFDIGYLNYE